MRTWLGYSKVKAVWACTCINMSMCLCQLIRIAKTRLCPLLCPALSPGTWSLSSDLWADRVVLSLPCRHSWNPEHDSGSYVSVRFCKRLPRRLMVKACGLLKFKCVEWSCIMKEEGSCQCLWGPAEHRGPGNPGSSSWPLEPSCSNHRNCRWSEIFEKQSTGAEAHRAQLGSHA